MKLSNDDSTHVLIVWADPQVYYDEELALLNNDSLDVNELVNDRYKDIPLHGLVCGDIIGDINFKTDYFGPTYYSFNRDKVHYLMIDNIFFLAKSYLYVGYLTEIQKVD